MWTELQGRTKVALSQAFHNLNIQENRWGQRKGSILALLWCYHDTGLRRMLRHCTSVQEARRLWVHLNVTLDPAVQDVPQFLRSL